VVSFQQLEEECSAEAKAKCPVSQCAGQIVPLYAYAVKAPPKSSIQRTASTASFVVVPDMDNVRCDSYDSIQISQFYYCILTAG
jgi:hypothetical protein